jgi:hypothetical protein
MSHRKAVCLALYTLKQTLLAVSILGEQFAHLLFILCHRTRKLISRLDFTPNRNLSPFSHRLKFLTAIRAPGPGCELFFSVCVCMMRVCYKRLNAKAN